MSKHNISSLVMCPWYKCQTSSVIYCEGPEENSSIHVAFSAPGEMRRFQAENCQTLHYAETCLIADAHERKWECYYAKKN